MRPEPVVVDCELAERRDVADGRRQLGHSVMSQREDVSERDGLGRRIERHRRVESPAELGEPILEERSLVATVLGTHAPPNTKVVSLEVGFESSRQAFRAYLYLLLDAKILESALRSLEPATG